VINKRNNKGAYKRYYREAGLFQIKNGIQNNIQKNKMNQKVAKEMGCNNHSPRINSYSVSPKCRRFYSLISTA